MKRIEIHWRDSRRYTYQMHDSEGFSVCIIKSCGWLVEKTKDYYVIAQDKIDDDWRGVAVIPTENVVKTILR